MTVDEVQPVVLAVDDAPDTLSLLSDIIEGAGMTALVARSGKSALSLIARVMPDLILMDAVMPDPDGFETCRRIKQDGAFAHIPVVFMTGLADTESVMRGFASGGTDYVAKPVVPREIVARIRAHLSNARMAQSARAALDVSGTPLVAVDDAGRIAWMTPEAAKLIAGIFGGGAGDPLWRARAAPVFARILAAKAVDTPLANKDGVPNASYLGASRPNEHLIRLDDRRAPARDGLLRARFGLTGREAEVLVWIAQGKSNRDVAEILVCSPRTVNKHLEQIFHKLNVENRTAAAMLAVRVLAEG